MIDPGHEPLQQLAATSAPAGRHLHVYYRVAESDLSLVLAAVRVVQAELVASRPGLTTGLWRRTDASGNEVTLMETYWAPGGIDAELEQTLAAAAQTASGWLRGQRHIEWFEPA